jgi:putative membrane protein
MLSAERTRLAYEGTLLSWMRTAISLITFGFAIYKFSADLLGNSAGLEQNRPLGSSNIALSMISAGLLALLLATIQHRQNIMALRAQHGTTVRSRSIWFSVLISCLGFISLIAVILRE